MARFTNWASAQQRSPQHPAPSIVSGLQLDSEVTEAITQGIRDQTEMAPYNGLAGKALDILRDLGRTWDIDVDTDRGEYQQEFEPPTISKTSSLSFYASNSTPEDLMWTISANTAMSSSPMGGGTRLQSPEQASALAGSLLFPSVPMHRYPSALTAKEPEEAGFASL